MKHHISLVITLCLVYLLNGQIQYGGTPVTFNLNNSATVPTVVMPAIEEASLRAADVYFDQDKSIPWRFGKNINVDIDMNNQGVWTQMPNGKRLYLLAIESPSAQTLNLGFDNFYLPEGAEMFLYNEDRTMVLGAFTAANNHDSGIFATTLIRGDKVYIEITEPASVMGQTTFHLNRVTHGYRSLEYEVKGIGDSGSCNNNVICPEGDQWRDQIRSVGILTVNGNGFCTGALINNTCQDGKPYFLTANHCVEGNSTADFNNIVVRFNFESTNCNSNSGPYPNHTISGTTLRANNAGSDFALLELNSVPPSDYNVYYAGWDRSAATPNTQVGIHHPAGDLKKISFDNQSAAFASYNGADTWRIFDWEDGTTEGGSSGSPLFDQNKRIIGQLFGGQASCSNNVNDYYGRFDVSWDGGNGPSNELQTWLDDCNTDVLVLDGYDPNVPVVDEDVTIAFVSTPADNSCGYVYPQEIRITNKGNLNVSSVTFNYGVDGTTDTYTWTGNLGTNESEVVTLPDLYLLSGVHTYSAAIISSSFGASDDNPTNDAFNFNVTVVNGTELVVNINTPFFSASENSFELFDNQGNIIESEGSFAGGTNYNYAYCIPDGEFCFVMYDSGGNGMGTGFFGGDFSLTLDGNLLYEGGEFFDVDSVCALASSGVSIEQVNPSFGLFVYPNPADNFLNVSVDSKEVINVFLYNTVGEIVAVKSSVVGKTTFDLNNFTSGIYFVKVENQMGSEVVKVLVK